MFRNGEIVVIVDDTIPGNDSRSWFYEGKGQLIGLQATFIGEGGTYRCPDGIERMRYCINLLPNEKITNISSRMCLLQHIRPINITLVEYQKTRSDK